MALFRYWSRSALLWGPTTTWPISEARFIGGAPALRTNSDTLVRTRVALCLSIGVGTGTQPPAAWWTTCSAYFTARFDVTGGDAISLADSDDPSTVMTKRLTQDLLSPGGTVAGYSVIFDTITTDNSQGQRKGAGADVGPPKVNVGLQLFDERGATWPPARFPFTIAADGLIETVWLSESSG